MVEERSKLATLCAALNDAGVAYLLIGSQALILWGSTRATRDVDILIEPTVENAQRLLDALADLGLWIVRDIAAAEVAAKPVTIIGDLWTNVDVFTVAWSIYYRDAVPAAITFTVDGVPIPTASIDHLIASKRTGRVRDALDIEVLEDIRRRRGG